MQNPEHLPVILGAVLAYFLIRYWQYAHDIVDKGFVSRFNQRRREYFRKRITEIAYADEGCELRQKIPELRDVLLSEFSMYGRAIPGSAYISWLSKTDTVRVELKDYVPPRRHALYAQAIATGYIITRTRLVSA
jgi:hypothetical protein